VSREPHQRSRRRSPGAFRNMISARGIARFDVEPSSSTPSSLRVRTTSRSGPSHEGRKRTKPEATRKSLDRQRLNARRARRHRQAPRPALVPDARRALRSRHAAPAATLGDVVLARADGMGDSEREGWGSELVSRSGTPGQDLTSLAPAPAPPTEAPVTHLGRVNLHRTRPLRPFCHDGRVKRAMFARGIDPLR